MKEFMIQEMLQRMEQNQSVLDILKSELNYVERTMFILIVLACVNTMHMIYWHKNPDKKDLEGKKIIGTPSTYMRFYLTLLVGMPFVYICAVVQSPHIKPLLRLFRNEFMFYIGTLVMIAGTATFVVAQKQMGSYYSPCSTAVVPGGLITSGIFSKVRHPIYMSKLLMMAGAVISCGSIFLIAQFLWGLSLYLECVKIEEEALCKEFPKYKAYQQTSWALFPKLF